MNTKKTLYFAALLVSGFFTFTSCEDECDETTWYMDADGDGYGNAALAQSACEKPAGYVSNATDVDDNNSTLSALWQGTPVTFTKANFADWSLAQNQDMISNTVSLTRQNKQGLFNSLVEIANYDACDGDEPTGTEWAYGTTSNYANLQFEPLGDLIGCNFSNIVDGRDMVLHIINEGIYIDIRFISWTQGDSNGGGFSYIRSTKN